ncbi:MAG: hypothetical protein JWM34_177 [Ilumatobacteraceae bacterium]|nr:hypothetical protein [Ilumatobacteraceae bacterium]
MDTARESGRGRRRRTCNAEFAALIRGQGRRFAWSARLRTITFVALHHFSWFEVMRAASVVTGTTAAYQYAPPDRIT